MSLNRILLPFNLKPHSEHLAEAAFSLAGRHGAEVECYFPQLTATTAVTFVTEATPPDMVERMIADARKAAHDARLHAKQQHVKWAAAHTDVPAHFVSDEGAIADIVAARARLADITICAPESAEDRIFWDEVLQGALFSSGRPVLLVPFARPSAKLGDRVVVAWQDTVEVARAIAGAKPFIDRAHHVELVSVGGDEAAEKRLNDVCAALGRNRAGVEVKMMPGSANVTETLMRSAGEKEGSILVIGAYSHWRWRERVFGGVTQSILRSARVPVLMVH